MSQGEVVKSGYLTKSPPEGRAAIAQWHRRWFVFSDSLLVYPLAKRYVRMEYYQSEEDARKLKDPKGRIDLTSCSQVTNRENMRGFKHVFDVCTSERTYHLVAESFQDKHDWMNTLNTTLFSSSHVHKSPSQPPLTTSHSHNQPSHPHIQNASAVQQQRNLKSGAPFRRNPDNGVSVAMAGQRPINAVSDSVASRQNQRPLPPVPRNISANRPLPPTPQPVLSSTPTRYKRTTSDEPNHRRQSCLRPTESSPQRKHRVVRQTKSSSCVQDGPKHYLLSSSPQPSTDRDYVNLDQEGKSPSPLPHGSRDYVNLEDQDYEDTVVVDTCVYEEYVPQASIQPPVISPKPAPISKPRGKVSGSSSSVGYENVEMPSDSYSVLEAVHPQPSRDGDYSHLEISNQGASDDQPSVRNKDYENLAHVPHPENDDYSKLHH